jgi:ankyrin repeat protein
MSTVDSRKLLTSLGLNNSDDPTLPLLEHIVDSIAALTEVVKDNAASGNESKATSAKTYGAYMGKLLANSLGRALTHMVTSDLSSDGDGANSDNTASQNSTQAINGYHQLSSRILTNFPSFSQVKGAKGEKMLIHHAAYKHSAGEGSTKNFEILLKAHPNAAKELDSMGATALHWATRNKNMTTAALQIIIAANTDASRTQDKAGYLPLHWAVCQDNPNIEVVQHLIKAYPQGVATACKESSLPVHWCVSREIPNLDVLKLLIEANSKTLKIANSHGNLPLHCCVERENPCIETVQLLMDAYPDALEMKNFDGHLPLHLAIDHDKPNTNVIKLLISANPSSTGIKDMHGHLPLHCLLDNPMPDFLLAEIVLEAFPTAAETMTEEGLYPIHIATNICDDPSPHFISELLNIFPQAVRHEVIDSVPIDDKANIHVWDGEWKEIRWTPFGRATERNLSKIVPILRAARFKAICASNNDEGGMKKTVGGGRGGSLSPERPGSPSRAAETHSPSLKASMQRLGSTNSGTQQGSPNIAKNFNEPSGSAPANSVKAASVISGTTGIINKYKASSP